MHRQLGLLIDATTVPHPVSITLPMFAFGNAMKRTLLSHTSYSMPCVMLTTIVESSVLIYL